MVLVVSFISFLLFVLIAYITKDICFHSKNTDSELQVYSASQFNNWKYISNMHNYGKGKTFLKDVSILMLVLFQKIFKDNISFFPVVTTVNFANSISIVLIYLNLNIFFGHEICLIITLTYIFSLWNYIVILTGGYQIVSQMFFLLAVYFINVNYITNLKLLNYNLFISGIFLCLMIFSSSSSHKYFPIYFCSIIFGMFVIKQHKEFKNILFYNYEIKNKVIIYFILLSIAANYILIKIKSFWKKVLVNYSNKKILIQ